MKEPSREAPHDRSRRLSPFVLGAFVAGAALTSGCPSGWHEIASGGCLTDSTHLAPSSGVRISDAVMLHRDPLWELRAGILVVGVLLASGILWIGLKGGRPSLPAL